jgi:hypothetical protein
VHMKSIYSIGFTFLLFDKIYLVSCPEKSRRPEIRLKKRLPKLKMSDFSENFLPLRTSGSTYPGVPHLRIRLF